MAEKFTHSSPFAAMNNNPINIIDPNGMEYVSAQFRNEEEQDAHRREEEFWYQMEENVTGEVAQDRKGTVEAGEGSYAGSERKGTDCRNCGKYYCGGEAFPHDDQTGEPLIKHCDGMSGFSWMFGFIKGELQNAIANGPGYLLAPGSSKLARGFRSFSAFKRAFGPAGKGMAWHHIVEQTPRNIARFGSEALHNTNNLIRLRHGAGTIHAKISGYYSSKQRFTNGLTVRQWISTKSFQEQYEFGIKTLERFGGQ